METRPLRTIALCCPNWPVVSAGAAAQAPVAVLEGEGPHQVVYACSPAARDSGVRRGQRVREARRRCPHLVLYRRDEAREAREFEDPRPSAARRVTDALSVVHGFDPPAAQDEFVPLVGGALANRLHLALAVAEVSCVRLGIEIVAASGRGSYRLWRHGGPIGGRLSAVALAERIRWQLAGWRARERYPVADPVVALRLVPDRLVADRGSHEAVEDLWDPQDSWDAQDPRSGGTDVPERVGRAIGRVEELLGPGAVQRPGLASSQVRVGESRPPEAYATDIASALSMT